MGIRFAWVGEGCPYLLKGKKSMAKRKGFIFTNKKHSDKAIMGSILGIISIASLIIVIFLSYQKQGDAPAGYGLTGLLATIFSVIGLVLGVVTARVRDTYPVFPWLAITLNGVALAAIGFLLYAGM